MPKWSLKRQAIFLGYLALLNLAVLGGLLFFLISRNFGSPASPKPAATPPVVLQPTRTPFPLPTAKSTSSFITFGDRLPSPTPTARPLMDIFLKPSPSDTGYAERSSLPLPKVEADLNAALGNNNEGSTPKDVQLTLATQVVPLQKASSTRATIFSPTPTPTASAPVTVGLTVTPSATSPPVPPWVSEPYSPLLTTTPIIIVAPHPAVTSTKAADVAAARHPSPADGPHLSK